MVAKQSYLRSLILQEAEDLISVGRYPSVARVRERLRAAKVAVTTCLCQLVDEGLLVIPPGLADDEPIDLDWQPWRYRARFGPLVRRAIRRERRMGIGDWRPLERGA